MLGKHGKLKSVFKRESDVLRSIAVYTDLEVGWSGNPQHLGFRLSCIRQRMLFFSVY